MLGTAFLKQLTKPVTLKSKNLSNSYLNIVKTSCFSFQDKLVGRKVVLIFYHAKNFIYCVYLQF